MRLFDWIKAVWFFVFDGIYSIICGDLDCPYCTFYRGVLLGLIVGFWLKALA